MHPLDLLKVKLQVATTNPQGGIGKAIWNSLRDIHATEGWKGLYRGVGPNIAGNASSWGLYFLLCVTFHPLQVRDAHTHGSATTCSKSVQPEMTQITECPLERTYFVPLKPVRTSAKTYHFHIFLTFLLTGAVTAVMTNPIWVVKVRMFTTRADAPSSYRGLFGTLSFLP